MIKTFAENYFEEMKRIFDELPLEKLEKVIEVLCNAYENESCIFIMGNGGSGSTASHFACDVNKGVSYGLKKRFRVISLNDNIPTILAYANDKSYDVIFVEQLANFLKPSDVVIGMSGSGNSVNVIKALQYANENLATSIGFTGFDGGQLSKTASISIVVPAYDMQKVEDLHLILAHIIMQSLHKKLRLNNG